MDELVGNPAWFWLLPGLVLVPDALGCGESTQNQDSSRISSSLKSLSSLATRSDKTSHPSWLLTGNGEHKTHPMLRWLIYAPSSGENSLLYNANVLPFPLIFLFPAFPTPHMNHFSHEAFSRMISLPEVFLFPSRNFHCGIHCCALSSFYESHPLGMNFLMAEDSFFLWIFHV